MYKTTLDLKNLIKHKSKFLFGIFGKNQKNEKRLHLENFIYNELKAYLSYYRIKKELCFWRTQSKHEVGFVIGNDVAIEVKAEKNINSKHLKGLEAIREEQII